MVVLQGACEMGLGRCPFAADGDALEPGECVPTQGEGDEDEMAQYARA